MKEISLNECQAVSAGCDVCGGQNKEETLQTLGAIALTTMAATFTALWYFGV